MQEITVKVPENRVPEFYEFFGKWLGGRLIVEPSDGEQGSKSVNEPPQPWQPSDGELASHVWDKLSDRAKGLFSLLADSPNAKFSAIALADQLEIPNGRFGLAGTLAWPGRHCAAVARKLPVRWRELEDDSEYWMTAEVADLFRSARDNESETR